MYKRQRQGPGWKPITRETAEAKGHNIIGYDTGRLFRSLVYRPEIEATKTTFVVGTSVAYAEYYDEIRSLELMNYDEIGEAYLTGVTGDRRDTR